MRKEISNGSYRGIRGYHHNHGGFVRHVKFMGLAMDTVYTCSICGSHEFQITIFDREVVCAGCFKKFGDLI